MGWAVGSGWDGHEESNGSLQCHPSGILAELEWGAPIRSSVGSKVCLGCTAQLDLAQLSSAQLSRGGWPGAVPRCRQLLHIRSAPRAHSCAEGSGSEAALGLCQQPRPRPRGAASIRTASRMGPGGLRISNPYDIPSWMGHPRTIKHNSTRTTRTLCLRAVFLTPWVVRGGDAGGIPGIYTDWKEQSLRVALQRRTWGSWWMEN